jgi:hypothetical protein
MSEILAQGKLLAVRLEAEIGAEEWQYMILEAISDRTGVGAVINLEAIRNSVLVQVIGPGFFAPG